MIRSCDEKRGGKLHEKNYDDRGQRTPQSPVVDDKRNDGETGDMINA